MRPSRARCALEAREPRVDAAPAGADEVDEKREVVDARVALGEEIALDPLESADRLVQQAADLGDVARDGKDLRSHAVAHRCTDVLGKRRLELRGGGRQRLDLAARALERGLDRRWLGPAGRGVRDALLRPLECLGIHGREATLLAGWTRPASSTTFRPSSSRRCPSSRATRRGCSSIAERTGTIEHRAFRELPDVLDGELVVVNDTRVVPARLRLRRESGGAAEVLLVERVDDNGTWEALVRPSRRLRAGEELGPVRLLEPLGEGRWVVALRGTPEGDMPLPPYIHEPLADPRGTRRSTGRSRARRRRRPPGCTSRPSSSTRSIRFGVTLHVGLDTFRPVAAETLEEHELHGERYSVAPESVGADRGSRACARGRHDDGARARDGRAIGRAHADGRRSSSRRDSSSAGSTRC